MKDFALFYRVPATFKRAPGSASYAGGEGVMFFVFMAVKPLYYPV